MGATDTKESVMEPQNSPPVLKHVNSLDQNGRTPPQAPLRNHPGSRSRELSDLQPSQSSARKLFEKEGKKRPSCTNEMRGGDAKRTKEDDKAAKCLRSTLISEMNSLSPIEKRIETTPPSMSKSTVTGSKDTESPEVTRREKEELVRLSDAQMKQDVKFVAGAVLTDIIVGPRFLGGASEESRLALSRTIEPVFGSSEREPIMDKLADDILKSFEDGATYFDNRIAVQQEKMEMLKAQDVKDKEDLIDALEANQKKLEKGQGEARTAELLHEEGKKIYYACETKVADLGRELKQSQEDLANYEDSARAFVGLEHDFPARVKLLRDSCDQGGLLQGILNYLGGVDENSADEKDYGMTESERRDLASVALQIRKIIYSSKTTDEPTVVGQAAQAALSQGESRGSFDKIVVEEVQKIFEKQREYLERKTSLSLMRKTETQEQLAAELKSVTKLRERLEEVTCALERVKEEERGLKRKKTFMDIAIREHVDVLESMKAEIEGIMETERKSYRDLLGMVTRLYRNRLSKPMAE